MSYSVLRTAEQFIQEVERTTTGWSKKRTLQSLEGQLLLVPHYVTMPEEERQKAKDYLSRKIEELKKG